jgi:hypothetical protein
MPSRSKAPRTSQAPDGTRQRWPRWPRRPAQPGFPKGETVTVVFHGLLAFCYNRRGEGEVGVYNGSEVHQLSLEVWEGTEGKGSLIYSYPVGQASHLAPDLVLEVNGPSLPGVWYYQPSEVFERLSSPQPEEKDFRWIVDLENGEFYGRKLEKNPDAFKPKLRLKHGLFYTYRKTNSTFKVRKAQSGSERPLGQIAHLVGANIYLARGGYAALRLGDQELRFNQRPGKKYEIHFKNDCEGEYEPRHPTDKRRRNDFHCYFEAVDVPPGEEEYELILDRGGRAAGRRVQDLALVGGVEIRSTDDAPCASSGYGKSPGNP